MNDRSPESNEVDLHIKISVKINEENEYVRKWRGVIMLTTTTIKMI